MVSGLRICIRTRIPSSWHGFLFNFSRYGQVALHRDWIIPRITSKMHWAFCEFQVCVNPRYCQSFPWSSFLCDAISWFSLPNTLHPFHILAPRNWNYCFHFTDEETEVETRQFFFRITQQINEKGKICMQTIWLRSPHPTYFTTQWGCLWEINTWPYFKPVKRNFQRYSLL